MLAKLLRSPVGLVCLTLLLLGAREAHAYCRETTISPQDGCACSHVGLPLFWADGDISYAFNERGFPDVSDDELRAAFARSFARWTSVRCDGQPVLLSVQALSTTTPMEKQADAGADNLNVITYLSEQAFLDEDHDPHAFALTTTSVRKSTGEIIDADMVFNDGLGPFVICPERGCTDGSVDIENVATHELGHFLGLAHSDVAGSTMECAAQPGQTNKRTLEDDDRAGICEIYSPPAVEERSESLHPRHEPSGCSLGARPRPVRTLPALVFGLCALCLLRRSRHR